MTFCASYTGLMRIIWDQFTYICLTNHIKIDQSRITSIEMIDQKRTNDQNESKTALIQYVDLQC